MLPKRKFNVRGYEVQLHKSISSKRGVTQACAAPAGIEVDSRVSAQPVGDEETLTGYGF
jgi:non-canonical (house-cleaning) NTP pyrophosphatase